jgi:HAMP domain-containing protein
VIPVTASRVLAAYVAQHQMRAQCAHGDAAMDAIYFRDKAETCLRLAKELSWNNPAREELMELAEEFQRQAEEVEASAGAERPRAR